MQLRWLEDFVELARTRSFTRAAENRFVTHPAFGRRIRALEEWVGTRLVERSKPLELTAAGTVFLDAATNALDILHSARTQLQDAAPTLENNLKIATGRTLAATFFPDWYDQMVARVGFFSATLSTSGAEEAILRLAAGEVDLLIVYSSAHTRLLIDQERFDWLSVAREVLVPVSALDAKGRARYRLTGGPAPIPWLAFTRTLTLRAVLARHLAEMPNRPMLKPVYQADSYEAILAMARRGTGIAWLPQRLVADDVARGTLAIVGGKDWQIGFDIALYRRAHQPHNVLDAIWQSARQASGDDA
ncbi:MULTISPECIES: LysR family transcriptional regulator [Pandoraea]|jgi:DNA-binding transcriptional LysR family regulator|uniref:LysR family transcriptional regulator n=1 Tax=Pandoraea pnomenusa TaxID=93220 RepID=A0A378YTP3_9BURK|nr:MULTISPECIES: LysR substrate-binding domain-containing protein [Pandoraea]AHB07423.1 LysR family transcriptional regulator [Pandoraea pnomenusa 3kgm]AHB76383.1 LysR family transcriptional regulator [Pandoraea pnomenusa]AIU28127.1 LysR family transcriptional regulator [Pandoraea pnomenusa]ANC45257.1 LysR family transcriptional regulator [Pandoraea pnomenusa]MBN9094835.1 LysR family transcriptional regulator [Pandoraea pnomenusa]